jgi:type I restriction enzyme, S subunit
MSLDLLPSGWSEILTSDSFKQISTNNKKVKSKECQSAGKFPVIDQGQMDVAGFIDDISKVINVKRPLVIFGDHTRIIKWVDRDFVPGADGTKILEAAAFLEPRYFYYQLKSIELPDKGYSRHFRYLNETSFRVAPFAEQQQIATKLDELLAQVDTLKTRLDTIPKILKRFRQSVLAAAVSGKLTENRREERNGGFWQAQKLEDVCLSISDGDHQAPPRSETGIPFLVISNISKGELDFENVERWVPEDYYQSLKAVRTPQKNDILYTVTGSFGIPVIVGTDERFCFQRHIAIIKPDHKVVNYKFLHIILCSIQGFKQAESIATGTAQKTVSLNGLRNFVFNFPSYEEQTEIVRRVEQLFTYADQIEQRVKDAQARVNHLNQAILAKAFRGEFTADWREQNPDLISGENSVEVLLAKIKAEREIAKSGKQSQKLKAK